MSATQTAAAPSASSCNSSGQTSGVTTSSAPDVGITAALTNDGGDPSLGAKVAAFDLIGGDSSADVGVMANLPSLGLADGGCDGSMLGGSDTDTGIQVALAADAPDIAAVPADFGLLGGDLLNASALDVPSLDLCSIGHSI